MKEAKGSDEKIGPEVAISQTWELQGDHSCTLTFLSDFHN